jgi:phosphoribosyl 1,2-cyclic phosphodiesterase
VRVKFWGVRGSIPAPGRQMARYGGNTSCVELTLSDGSQLILDAGTGIRELPRAEHDASHTTHVLLTHLHLDHIQGLMFFPPLFDPEADVTVWGPPWFDAPLLNRLGRYISAPLAPVEIRELPALVEFVDAPASFDVGPARVEAALVNHRGPTLAYRITDGDTVVAYIPDHEPALGQRIEASDGEWISGYTIARDADLLIHDAQYTDEEYGGHLGWGHSALCHSLAFAQKTGTRRLALFHHDPQRTDDQLDRIGADAAERIGPDVQDVFVARELDVIDVTR